MLPQCVCVVSTEAPERHERTRENKKKKKRKEKKKDSFFCQALRGGHCEHDRCQWKFVINKM